MIPLHSNLQEFKTVADWQLSSESDEAFFELQHPLSSLAFDDPFLKDNINAELSAILKAPLQVSRRWKADHVIAATEGRWQLQYGLVSETREFVYSKACHAMYAVIGPEPLNVDFYTPSHSIDTDVFDAGVRLSKPIRKVFKPGSICVVNARREIADFIVQKPTAVLTLHGPTRCALQWVFSRQTLRAVQSMPSNPADAEIAILIRALTAMQSTSSVSTLCALTAHESHFVRWTALQSLMKLSPEAARSSLQRATEDTHPHVRMASEKAIAAMAA